MMSKFDNKKQKIIFVSLSRSTTKVTCQTSHTGQGQMQNNTAVCSCRDLVVIVKWITFCVKIINRESLEL